MTFREYLKLFFLNLLVKLCTFVEYLKILLRYYKNPLFRRADLALLRRYLFRSPYAISKQFLLERGESDLYTYGETPLTTLELIARQCEITPQDTVYELGCGRGRSCFWLSCFWGCRAVGIEYIPDFVIQANQVKAELKLDKVEFRLEDILKTDLKSATILYLYGSCYEETFLKKLIKRLSKLPSGTKIITVSYPLTDYTLEPLFERVKRFEAPFTWGKTDVYLQKIT